MQLESCESSFLLPLPFVQLASLYLLPPSECYLFHVLVICVKRQGLYPNYKFLTSGLLYLFQLHLVCWWLFIYNVLWCCSGGGRTDHLLNQFIEAVVRFSAS